MLLRQDWGHRCLAQLLVDLARDSERGYVVDQPQRPRGDGVVECFRGPLAGHALRLVLRAQPRSANDFWMWLGNVEARRVRKCGRASRRWQGN